MDYALGKLLLLGVTFKELLRKLWKKAGNCDCLLRGGSLKIHTDHAPTAVESLIREQNVPFAFLNGILEIKQDILESWEVLLIKDCFK